MTTIFPRQEHYALDPQHVAGYPAADVTIDRIGELLNHNLDGLLTAVCST